MSIEVRQISIRSQVVVPESKSTSSLTDADWNRMKEEILSECRQMLLQMLRAERER